MRSQDKYTLEKIEALQICENPDGTWFFNSGFLLGKYKTKERALEVLDEIQKYIADSFSRQEAEQFFGGIGTTRKSKIVYQMPKE